MKKTVLFLSSALFVAFMAVSCGNNTPEATEDTTPVVEEPVVEEEPVAEEEVAATTAEPEAAKADKSEILSKAREAGQAKCNCYKKDAASVEACFKAILNQTYAAYQNDADFQKEMKAEYNKCIKEKATAAAKDAGEKALKEGANALANRLNKK